MRIFLHNSCRQEFGDSGHGPVVPDAEQTAGRHKENVYLACKFNNEEIALQPDVRDIF